MSSPKYADFALAPGAAVQPNGLGDPAEIEPRRATLQDQAGVQVRFHGADLAEPTQVDAPFEAAERELGPVEVLAARQPSGRFVQPEQVADLIVFLCSPAASEMTGTPVAIDGGCNAI